MLVSGFDIFTWIFTGFWRSDLLILIVVNFSVYFELVVSRRRRGRGSEWVELKRGRSWGAGSDAGQMGWRSSVGFICWSTKVITWNILGSKNKINYFLFLIIPLLIWVWLSKWLGLGVSHSDKLFSFLWAAGRFVCESEFWMRKNSV